MKTDLETQLLAPSSRGKRRQVVLDGSPGLYALFVSPDCRIASLAVNEGTLLCIGKADGAGGLRTRCHFKGGTRNHSPRKSLAVLLEKERDLRPKPISNPNGSYKTWGPEGSGEAALSPSALHRQRECWRLQLMSARNSLA